MHSSSLLIVSPSIDWFSLILCRRELVLQAELSIEEDLRLAELVLTKHPKSPETFSYRYVGLLVFITVRDLFCVFWCQYFCMAYTSLSNTNMSGSLARTMMLGVAKDVMEGVAKTNWLSVWWTGTKLTECVWDWRSADVGDSGGEQCFHQSASMANWLQEWRNHNTGLEINILRQWTTGPPALRIWWSGLKSSGPENYILHFHLKCITEHVQWSTLIRYWQFTIWILDNRGR